MQTGAACVKTERGRWIAVLCALCFVATPRATSDGEIDTPPADHGMPRHYPPTRAFWGTEPYRLFASSEGDLWLAVSGGAVHYDGWTTRSSYRAGQPLWPGYIREIVQTRDQTIWFLTDAHLRCYRDGVFYCLRTTDTVSPLHVRSIVEDQDGHVWAATETGVARLAIGENGPVVPGVEDIPMQAPHVARARAALDGMWFMIWRGQPQGDALLLHKRGGWWLFDYNESEQERLPGPCLHDMAVDKQGYVFVTTCQALHRYDGAQWKKIGPIPYDEKGQSHRKDRNRLLLTEDGTIWVSNLCVKPDDPNPASLLRFSPSGTRRAYSNRDGLEDVLCLARRPNGEMLAGTSKGVRRLQGDSWKIWDRSTALARTMTQQIVVASDGALWFRTPDGVFSYATGAEPPRIRPIGDWPTRIRESFGRFEVHGEERWGVSGSVAVEVSLDGQAIRTQSANEPIALSRLSHGSHVLEVFAMDAFANRAPPAIVHSFHVSLPLWQRGDLLLILLVSFLFIAAPSLGFAYYKHRRLRQSLEELRLANLKLQEADNLRSNFIAGVSHELRTPVQAIVGFAGNLLDRVAGPLSDKQAQMLSQLTTYANRLGTLIEDVLDLRRIESGRIALQRTAVKLQDLARLVIKTLQPQAEEKHIRISFVANGECPAVWADSDRVLQVYTNLIGNALKFTPAHGTIDVRVEAQDEQWVQSAIRDTGPGIPPEEHERIFERFHQVTAGRRQRTAGTGLGLAICKELIELHGGTIRVESAPGQGSTFCFRLPSAGATGNKPAGPSE